jgi:hypothetical protein
VKSNLDRPEAYRKRKREYARTPEQRSKRREYLRKWVAANPDKVKAQSARRRRKKGQSIREPAAPKPAPGPLGRPKQTTCKWGHDLSIHRVVTPGGHTRCAACRAMVAEKMRQYRRSHPEKAQRCYINQMYGRHVERGPVCEVCGDTGRLSIDHCHKTGLVRGTLCTKCNFGIGALRDSADLVRKALEYLVRPRPDGPFISPTSGYARTLAKKRGTTW